MPFWNAIHSDLPWLRRAIAEDALALSGAFVDKDLQEIGFRVALLLSHAREAGAETLAEASETLLIEVNGVSELGKDDTLSCSLERVIAAAASVVTADDRSRAG